MSVTVMMAVAVLERPKFRLPSMSVACTIMVYWDTFCKGKKKQNSVSSYSCAKSFPFQQQTKTVTPRGKKAELVFFSIPSIYGLI